MGEPLEIALEAISHDAHDEARRRAPPQMQQVLDDGLGQAALVGGGPAKRRLNQSLAPLEVDRGLGSQLDPSHTLLGADPLEAPQHLAQPATTYRE